MAKQINTQKLEALGIGKARQACVIHATAAIKAKERGDTAAFHKHSDLLDQCAAIGRKILYGDPARKTRPTAAEAVNQVA